MEPIERMPTIMAEPVGAKYSTKSESDISEISFGATGLRVVVETKQGLFEPIRIEYHFVPRGFRFLDEGDLIRYWESNALMHGYHLFKIASGGWLDQELQVPGMLSVTQAVGTFQEWFICTTNGCLNVLSVNEPLIREFK